MRRTYRLLRATVPLLAVLLSCMGACAMYDITAFDPEGWEEEEAALEDVGEGDETVATLGEGEAEDGEEEAEEPAAEEPEGPEEIVASASSVTITWDPPDSPVSSYKIYYREHDYGSWIPLEEVPPDPPEYDVPYSSLGNGSFDFAVTAVYAGQESDMHTSLDGTAAPERGWFLLWHRDE